MYALLMVKNEADVVTKTLKTVASRAEKIFVFDTGSTDNTVEICKNYAPHIEVKEGPWVNFAVSRNEALKWVENEVPRDSWILMLDAADELRGLSSAFADELRLHDSKINGILIKYVWFNDDSKSRLERRELKLIRAGRGWRWKHPVHEMLCNDKPNCIVSKTKIRVCQDRSTTELKKFKSRLPWDLAVLNAEHLEKNECTRTMFYLAQTLSALGKKKEALEMYMKRCASSEGDSWEKYRAMIRCGDTYAFFSKVNEAIDWYLRAVSESERLGTFNPAGLIHAGRICRQIGRPKLAYMYLRYAAQFDVDDNSPYHVDTNLMYFTKWNELSVTAWRLGKFEEGKNAAMKAGTDVSWFDPHPIFKASYYINLKKRVDRKLHVETELKKILVNDPVRIDALSHEMGIVGCLQSHIKTLETFMSSSSENFVSIFEDDVVFKNPDVVVKGVRELSTDNDWDVLMLGGMNDGPVEKYKNFSAVRISRCMSCVAYVVRRSYVPTLLTFWKKFLSHAEAVAEAAAKHLPLNLDDVSLDRAWFELQQKHTFVLITPLSVSQLSSYSDNWKRTINWDKSMMAMSQNHLPKII